MPNEIQVLTFTFVGRAVESSPIGETTVPPEQEPLEKALLKAATEEQTRRIERANSIALLNARSQTIAQEIEEELRSILPPFANVRAEVHFSAGSIIMAGTIVILNWASALIVKAAKDTVEEQLSSLVKLAVQRVFTRIVTTTPGVTGFQATEVGVTPQTQTPAQTAVEAAAPTPDSGERTVPRLWPIIWFLVGLILLIEILALVDSWFIIIPR